MYLSFLWCLDLKWLCFWPLTGTRYCIAKELVEEKLLCQVSELRGRGGNLSNISAISHISQIR